MTKKCSFDYSFQIHFHEVDRAGVLFFAHLFTHAHDAYELFMANLGMGLDRTWSDQEYVLPIVSATADYHAPFHHGMTVTVRITIPHLGQSSFTTSYNFLEPEGRQHAQVRLVHCCVDITTGKARVLPDTLRALLARACV